MRSEKEETGYMRRVQERIRDGESWEKIWEMISDRFILELG